MYSLNAVKKSLFWGVEMTRSKNDHLGNAAALTPRPISPEESYWSFEATSFCGNCVTVKRESADLLPRRQPMDPRPRIFTFKLADRQNQVGKPSFCTLHNIPAAVEETGGASSAFTEPAHTKQEAPVTAASGAALKIDITLSPYSKMSHHPAQHVSAAIGQRSGKSPTMWKFFSDKSPSTESPYDGNLTP